MSIELDDENEVIHEFDFIFSVTVKMIAEECGDVISYTKKYFAVHFTIDYRNADGNISNYYPDLIVKIYDSDT